MFSKFTTVHLLVKLFTNLRSQIDVYHGALGVELGSSKIVMACFGLKGLEIILSETSDKSTQAIVAYTASERIIGLAASHQRKRNLKNSL